MNLGSYIVRLYGLFFLYLIKLNTIINLKNFFLNFLSLGAFNNCIAFMRKDFIIFYDFVYIWLLGFIKYRFKKKINFYNSYYYYFLFLISNTNYN